MSKAGNKSDWTILAWLGVVSVLILSALMLFLHDGDEDSNSWIRSSRSVNNEGTALFFRLLESFEYPIHESDMPLNEETLSRAGTVFLVEPLVPIKKEEIEALRSWVLGGGLLVTTIRIEELHPRLKKICRAYEDEDQEVEDPNRPQFDISGHTRLQATLTKEGKISREVRKVCFENLSHFIPDPCSVKLKNPINPYRVLYEDQLGHRIVEVYTGMGKVILLSDSFFLCNRGILLVDNSILAANLAFHALPDDRAKTVLYDEYHYTWSAAGQTGLGLMRHLLWTTAPGWSVLCILAAALACIYRESARFGIARSTERTQRRSKMEFINSLGQTFRQAGAHKLVFDILYRDFREKLIRRAALHPQTPNAVIIREIGKLKSFQARPADLTHALDWCDTIAQKQKISEQQFRQAVGQLTKIEKELLS